MDKYDMGRNGCLAHHDVHRVYCDRTKGHKGKHQSISRATGAVTHQWNPKRPK